MTADARNALAFIRRCLENDRYIIAVHFAERMEQRGLFWPDVQAVIEEPQVMRSQGMGRYNRAKWLISGEAATGDEIEIVCALEIDETEFITLYWED